MAESASNTKEKTSKGTWVIIFLLATILFSVFGAIVINNSKSDNKPTITTNTTSIPITEPSSSQPAKLLQECINSAHSQYDSAIAAAEILDKNAQKYPQSSLDLAIANCHQQYGY